MHFLVRDLDEPPAAAPLPDGFRLRTVEPADVPERVAIHRDVWAPSRVTESSYAQVRAQWPYRASLDCVCEAPDGRFAAYCLLWPDDENGVGELEPVGVRDAFRRRGLGAAVCTFALERWHEEGGRQAVVYCVGDAACALYRSLGFRVHATRSSFAATATASSAARAGTAAPRGRRGRGSRGRRARTPPAAARAARPPAASRARARTGRPSASASGFASRLSAQAGGRDLPQFEPARTSRSPSRPWRSGTRRGCPLRRPVVSSQTSGKPPSRVARPPVRRSSHGSTRAATAAKSRLRPSLRTSAPTPQSSRA